MENTLPLVAQAVLVGLFALIVNQIVKPLRENLRRVRDHTHRIDDRLRRVEQGLVELTALHREHPQHGQSLVNGR